MTRPSRWHALSVAVAPATPRGDRGRRGSAAVVVTGRRGLGRGVGAGRHGDDSRWRCRSGDDGVGGGRRADATVAIGDADRVSLANGVTFAEAQTIGVANCVGERVGGRLRVALELVDGELVALLPGNQTCAPRVGVRAVRTDPGGGRRAAAFTLNRRGCAGCVGVGDRELSATTTTPRRRRGGIGDAVTLTASRWRCRRRRWRKARRRR